MHTKLEQKHKKLIKLAINQMYNNRCFFFNYKRNWELFRTDKLLKEGKKMKVYKLDIELRQMYKNGMVKGQTN